MNCPQCESSIDYRFPTTCLNCNCELMLVSDAAPPVSPDCKQKAPLKFRHHLANLTLIAATTFVGMIGGGVVTYVIGAALYVVIFTNKVSDSYSCARGTAIGMLLILAGTNAGSVVGGIFGFVHRTFKTVS